MSRARNIKPGFFRNADLADLPFEARLLFIGLWTLADREGRLEDRPKQIKMEIFPTDNVDCEALIEALASINMVQRYQCEGISYLLVVNFTKHQNPHKAEKVSTIPAPCLHHACTVLAPDKHGSSTRPARLIPDILIPDVLNPDIPIAEPIKQIPKVKPVMNNDTELRKVAYETLILSLNSKAKRKYEPYNSAYEPTHNELWYKIKATPISELPRIQQEGEMIIDDLVGKWLNDSKMKEFLRPSTVFQRAKWDERLDNAKNVNEPEFFINADGFEVRSYSGVAPTKVNKDGFDIL